MGCSASKGSEAKKDVKFTTLDPEVAKGGADTAKDGTDTPKATPAQADAVDATTTAASNPKLEEHWKRNARP